MLEVIFGCRMDREFGSGRAVPSNAKSVDIGEMIRGTMIAGDSWRIKLKAGKIMLVDYRRQVSAEFRLVSGRRADLA